jgi:hypothetical protein
LKDVFAESSVIVYGAVIGSGAGSCGGQEGVNSFYILRVTDITKGDMQKGDIKACGSAPMLLDNLYLIAGTKFSNDEITFSPDAVLLVFPSDEYYRLISYDGPIVTSNRGDAYAVGILEPSFVERFGEVVNRGQRGKRTTP